MDVALRCMVFVCVSLGLYGLRVSMLCIVLALGFGWRRSGPCGGEDGNRDGSRLHAFRHEDPIVSSFEEPVSRSG